MKKITYISIILLSFILLLRPVSHAYYPCQPIQGEIWVNPWWSQQVVNWTSDYRHGLSGLNRLIRTDWLNRWAESKLLQIYQTKVLAHDQYGWTWTQTANSCGIYPQYGENIGHAYATPGAMWNAWYNSPSHRFNMYYPPYRFIGSACAYMYGLNVGGNISDGITCVVVFSD